MISLLSPRIKQVFFCSADSSVDAPPSFKPAKKYADLSGLPVSIKKT